MILLKQILLGLLLILSFSLPQSAYAENFNVKTRIFCPASLVVSGTNPVTVDADFNDANIHWVPCAGIHVSVMDADPGFDTVCATAYTDSRGFINTNANCSDPIGRPGIYLSVESKSILGFSVGTWDYDFWDVLKDLGNLYNDWATVIGNIGNLADGPSFPDIIVSHKTSKWVTAEVGVEKKLDFGDLWIGGGVAATSRQEPSIWAAREFWIAQRSMYQIHLGSYRPFYFKWTVDTPWFGAPTALWDTIIVDNDMMKDSSRRGHAFKATPHEIGHVIHNKYHSNYRHWIYRDALQYAKEHKRCEDKTLVLGWYEGFANFVKDYVYSAVDHTGRIQPSETHNYKPFAGCTTPSDSPPNPPTILSGLAFEGNNQAILNRIYYGPLDMTYKPDYESAMAHEFSCPTDFSLIQKADNKWYCLRSRLAMCQNPIEDTLVVDANGVEDRCEREPEPGLPWSGMTISQDNCTTGICLPLEIPIIDITSNPADTEDTQVTITVEATVDENGDPLPDQSNDSGSAEIVPDEIPERAPITDLATATQVFSIGCSVLDNPTGKIKLVKQLGRDICIEEDSEATWQPPENLAAGNDLRVDGLKRSVIVPNLLGQREWFGLPDMDDMIRLIQNSGNSAHTMQEHWNASIGNFCRGTDPYNRDWFCNPDSSPVFRNEVSARGSLRMNP